MAFRRPDRCSMKTSSNRTDMIELRMVEEGSAYYLIPGTLVRVMQDDQTNGMSEILLGGLTKPLWTYNKFLIGRPIRDIYLGGKERDGFCFQ